MADREDFAAAVGALIKGLRSITPNYAAERLGTMNLDDVTDQRIYLQPISGNATEARNYPPGEYRGYLWPFIAPGQTNVLVHLWIGASTGKLWLRERYGNTWGAWAEIGGVPAGTATQSWVRSSAPVLGMSLGSTHLDSITAPGWRPQPASALAVPANGYPENAERCEVLTVPHGGNLAYQMVMAPLVGKAWMREKYSGTWGAWRMLGGESGPAKVQQQRTIAVIGDYRPDPPRDGGVVAYWTGPSGVERIDSTYQGDGYVGRLGAATAYTTMQLRKVQANNEVEVSCLDPVAGRHVTHRVQGQSPNWQDDQRRFEEGWVGAYSGTTVAKDLYVLPRSNIEWAFQIEVGGNSQFAPYHGSTSAQAVQYEPATITDLTGNPIDIASLAVDQVITGLDGFKTRQRMYLTHPDSGDTQWADVDEVRTIYPDGMIQSEAVITFLRDTLVRSNYSPMTPVGQEYFDQLHVLDGATYPALTTPPETTVYDPITEKHNATSALFTSSTTDAFVAVAYLDPDGTFMRGHALEETGDLALRLEQRSTAGLTKLYPTVFDPGSVIPAGTVWRPSAQWRYGETANAAQYA